MLTLPLPYDGLSLNDSIGYDDALASSEEWGGLTGQRKEWLEDSKA